MLLIRALKKTLIPTIIGIAGIVSSVSIATAQDEAVKGLREMIFKLKPAEIGLTRENFAHPVWGLIMETGYVDGSFTLLALADGTTSLYFSNGGGIIGGGQNEAVRNAAGYYLSGAQYFLNDAVAVEAFPGPVAGEVKFYFLSFEGLSHYSATEDLLGSGDDKLSNLFYAAHKVIDELREFEEK